VSAVTRWEDPPPKKGKHDWPATVRALKARPGEWAMVIVFSKATVAASTARNVRDGKYYGIDAGTSEAVSRTIDGEARVYARYVGESP